jgi:pilus assembly protein Flp/PilA
MTAILVKSIIMKNEIVNKFNSTIKKINSQDNGVTAVEYALIIGLIAIVIIGAVTFLGTNISNLFSKARCAVVGGVWTEPAANVAATVSSCTK